MKPADGHPNGLLECEMKLGAGHTEMRLEIYGMKSDTCKTTGLEYMANLVFVT